MSFKRAVQSKTKLKLGATNDIVDEVRQHTQPPSQRNSVTARIQNELKDNTILQ